MRYFQKRKKRNLYRQWIEMSSLSPDAVPQEEDEEDIILPNGGDGQKSGLWLLYILLAIAVVAVCAGIILLVVYS